MIFKYDELKEYVTEDFNRFWGMGFDEKQIFPAILAEYQYAPDFCLVERICIYVSITLVYMENNLNPIRILDELEKLIEDNAKNLIKDELCEEYERFLQDINKIQELRTYE